MAQRHCTPRFGFVVLHYLADSATMDCVESIERHCPDASIVVVDNNSANGSFERLQKRFANDAAVTLLHNETNEGFACGNNMGYIYARERLHCGFIATVNNDAVIDCDDFESLCREDARRNPDTGVIGPDIVSGKNGSHSNPVYSVIDMTQEVDSQIRRFKHILLLLHLHLYHPLVRIKSMLTRTNPDGLADYMNSTAEEIPGKPFKLHGSCMVFTPAFVQKYREPFDPGTFLYFEEDILLMRCRQAGLAEIYDKRLKVRHAEDVATDQSMPQNTRRKMIFTLDNYVRSLKVLRRYVN